MIINTPRVVVPNKIGAAIVQRVVELDRGTRRVYLLVTPNREACQKASHFLEMRRGGTLMVDFLDAPLGAFRYDGSHTWRFTELGEFNRPIPIGMLQRYPEVTSLVKRKGFGWAVEKSVLDLLL